MLLFPRLGAMSLDTPERVKYFGLRNNGSCGICRRRQGRSATRRATCHNPTDVKNKYTIACSTAHGQGRRKRARKELRRHGLDWEKRCRLPELVRVCLYTHAFVCIQHVCIHAYTFAYNTLQLSAVHVEKFGPRLFHGLCRYERMHVYYIGFCTYLTDLLIKCVRPRHYDYVHKVVLQCHQFRDPVTGTTHPRLPYILKMSHLTAERRVRGIFYWAHVLGLKAEVIDEPIRMSAQCAVAYLQLILIATRGHRAYTSQELLTIFEDVGRQFYIHLEKIAEYLERQRFERLRQDHERDPERHLAPLPIKRPKRLYTRSIACIQTCYIHTQLRVYKMSYITQPLLYL